MKIRLGTHVKLLRSLVISQSFTKVCDTEIVLLTGGNDSGYQTDSKLDYQVILTKQRNLRQFLHFLEAVATVTELKCYRAEALSLFTVMLKCDKSTDYYL